MLLVTLRKSLDLRAGFWRTSSYKLQTADVVSSPSSVSRVDLSASLIYEASQRGNSDAQGLPISYQSLRWIFRRLILLLILCRAIRIRLYSGFGHSLSAWCALLVHILVCLCSLGSLQILQVQDLSIRKYFIDQEVGVSGKSQRRPDCSERIEACRCFSTPEKPGRWGWTKVVMPLLISF